MQKQQWKAGNMVYPLPVVMVSCKGANSEDNILTVAWTGTVCTNPPMVYISVRPERHSYHMIKETGEFVINLTTKKLAYATDYCGVRSGNKVDKWTECKLTKISGQIVNVPLIGESPVNIECKVDRIIPLGSHDMFLASVVAVHVDEQYMDDRGKFHLSQANPIVYSHGEYYDIGSLIGTFGYSVKKNLEKKKARKKNN